MVAIRSRRQAGYRLRRPLNSNPYLAISFHNGARSRGTHNASIKPELDETDETNEPNETSELKLAISETSEKWRDIF